MLEVHNICTIYAVFDVIHPFHVHPLSILYSLLNKHSYSRQQSINTNKHEYAAMHWVQTEWVSGCKQNMTSNDLFFSIRWSSVSLTPNGTSSSSSSSSSTCSYSSSSTPSSSTRLIQWSLRCLLSVNSIVSLSLASPSKFVSSFLSWSVPFGIS